VVPPLGEVEPQRVDVAIGGAEQVVLLGQAGPFVDEGIAERVAYRGPSLRGTKSTVGTILRGPAVALSGVMVGIVSVSFVVLVKLNYENPLDVSDHVASIGYRRFPEAIGGVGCNVTLTHGKPAFLSSGVVAKTAGTLSSPSSKKSSPPTSI